MPNNEYKDGDTLAPDKTVAVVAGATTAGLARPILVDDDGNVQIEGTLSTTPVATDAQLIEAVFITETTVAAASITGAYVSLLALPDNTRAVFLVNDTDGDVYISFDSVSNHIHLSPGDRFTIDLASLGLKSTAAVSAKDGATASTTGTMRASAVRG